MPRMYIPIWPHACSMGFISGEFTDQGMTSTCSWARKPRVWRAVWQVALSWTNTKLFCNIVLANGTMEFLSMSTSWKWLRVPLTNTNSDLAPWWLAPKPWHWRFCCHDLHLHSHRAVFLPASCALVVDHHGNTEWSGTHLQTHNGASVLLANSDSHGSIVLGTCGDLASGQESSLVDNHGYQRLWVSIVSHWSRPPSLSLPFRPKAQTGSGSVDALSLENDRLYLLWPEDGQSEVVGQCHRSLDACVVSCWQLLVSSKECKQ